MMSFLGWVLLSMWGVRHRCRPLGRDNRAVRYRLRRICGRVGAAAAAVDGATIGEEGVGVGVDGEVEVVDTTIDEEGLVEVATDLIRYL